MSEESLIGILNGIGFVPVPRLITEQRPHKAKNLLDRNNAEWWVPGRNLGKDNIRRSRFKTYLSERKKQCMLENHWLVQRTWLPIKTKVDERLVHCNFLKEKQITKLTPLQGSQRSPEGHLDKPTLSLVLFKKYVLL